MYAYIYICNIYIYMSRIYIYKWRYIHIYMQCTKKKWPWHRRRRRTSCSCGARARCQACPLRASTCSGTSPSRPCSCNSWQSLTICVLDFKRTDNMCFSWQHVFHFFDFNSLESSICVSYFKRTYNGWNPKFQKQQICYRICYFGGELQHLFFKSSRANRPSNFFCYFFATFEVNFWGVQRSLFRSPS